MKSKIYLKIIKNLKKPHLIPEKIFFKLKVFFNFIFYEINYDAEKFKEKQSKIFNEISLDYKSGINFFDNLKNKYEFLKPDNELPHSEHSIFFSSLSLKYQDKFKNILEIGTYNGKNAFLLSQLFAKCKIYTLDLPDNDQIFSSSYKRDTTDLKNLFIKRRNEILNKSKNIEMVKKNSVHLMYFKNKFDLIWVDGAHYCPIVCFDILNSLKLINTEGFILCDDISLINYNATIESLKILKAEKIIDYKLIYKNVDARKNAHPKRRSYIAVVTKVNKL
tara:strand:- start:47 stop:877 length:831 start_codon:yes stop_codon:yes gene_type:complete